MKKYMLLGAVAALVLTVGMGQARAAPDCGRELCEGFSDVVGIINGFEATDFTLAKRLETALPFGIRIEEKLAGPVTVVAPAPAFLLDCCADGDIYTRPRDNHPHR